MRAVADLDAVMDFVAFAQSAQDGNRVFDARLVHEHGLEPALERLVLFDVFPVFVKRCRADAVQFAARKHGLEQVARVHGAFGGARAHDRVEFVNKQDDAALGLGQLP